MVKLQDNVRGISLYMAGFGRVSFRILWAKLKFLRVKMSVDVTYGLTEGGK